MKFLKNNWWKFSITFILSLWLYPFLPLNPTIPDTYSLLRTISFFKTNPLNAMWITLSNFGGAFETLGIGDVQAFKFLPFSIPLMAFLTFFELLIIFEPIIISAILYFLIFTLIPHIYHLTQSPSKK